MGLSIHPLYFLLKTLKENKTNSRVCTFGRQRIRLYKDQRKLIDSGLFEKLSNVRYFDELKLGILGIERVDILDASAYEGANIVHDLNQQVPLKHCGQYDVVVDSGTTEHVFNASQSILNAIKLAKLGGIILHMLPSDGCSGHGFWQVSPDLFYSLYSNENGFTDTEIYYASKVNETEWTKLCKPRYGKRLEIKSWTSGYILVKTKKIKEVISYKVEQSDYTVSWSGEHKTTKKWGLKIKKILMHFQFCAKNVREITEVFKAISYQAHTQGRKIKLHKIVL